jgi:limonene-1,2-epoxide hydrolase
MSDIETTPSSTSTPTDVVRRLLDALVDFDRQALEATLADDVAYTNVSLPTIHGRRAAGRALATFFDRRGVTFEVMVLNIAAVGPVVLTERIDVINAGRLRLQFWVVGRFEVSDGKVTVWRDYFDYYDTTRAMVRAIVGAVVPSLKPRFPDAGSASTKTR